MFDPESSYKAKILLDSVAPSGVRLTTFELTYPRFIHAELMTHRLFSRNSASSRAIPVEKLIARIENEPAMPVWWGKNQAGMQAKEELDEKNREWAQRLWLEARDEMLDYARKLADIGLHKQIANRILEPWMFITVILTATEYENFFALRCHPDAQPEFQHIARKMQALYRESRPVALDEGQWHMPLLREDDWREAVNGTLAPADLQKISVGRCARVSYLTHDGRRAPAEDIALCDRLIVSGHMSPTEHVAMALREPTWHGNFRGWKQYRKTIPGEAVFVPQTPSPA